MAASAPTLYRIGRIPTSDCEHCGEEDIEDTVEHTLGACVAWEYERAELCTALGMAGITLQTIIPKILDTSENWHMFADYANTIMIGKERAERHRQELEALERDSNDSDDSAVS